MVRGRHVPVEVVHIKYVLHLVIRDEGYLLAVVAAQKRGRHYLVESARLAYRQH